MSFLKHPSAQLIINQINVDNKTALTSAQINFGTPRDGTTQSGNTDLAIVATPGGGYVGSVLSHYDRYDLSKLFNRIKVILRIADPSVVLNTTTDLIPYLNARYGLGLVADEVQSSPIDQNNLDSEGRVIHTVVINSTKSVAYKGQRDVLIQFGAAAGSITTEAGVPLITEAGSYLVIEG